MFVFLVLRIQCHFHAFAGEFTARERAQADDDLAHRFLAAFFKLGAVVPGVGRPGFDHGRQVVDQQLGGDRQVLGAALGVFTLALDVVLKRAVARAGVALVLAPEQELDGVPAGADVLFTAALVGLDQRGLGDLEVGVVDHAGLGLAGHVVHIGLVQRPGVDLAFGALVIVDRAAVEAEGFGLAVELARVQPGLAGFLQTFGGGCLDELGNGGLHVFGRGQGVAVVGMHQGGVVGRHGLEIHRGDGGCSRCRGLGVGRQGRQRGAGGQGGKGQGQGAQLHGNSFCKLNENDSSLVN